MNNIPEIHVTSQGRLASCCHVNRKLLPIKGFYFAFLAAVGSLLPFIAIYMKQLGLTPSETGILYGSMPFIGFFVRPIIGAVADRWRKHKLTLMICSVLTGIFYLLILTIPAREHSSFTVHVQLDCNVQDSYFRDCVSLSGAKVDHTMCVYGLSEFADKMLNITAENNTDLDCDVHCEESKDSISKDVDVCFTNSSHELDKQCDGTLISHVPFSFGLANISHVLKNELVGDKNTISTMKCRDYDLKSLSHNGQHYWQLLCDQEGTFDCDMTCVNPPPQLCVQNNHEFDYTFGWLFLIYLIANLAFAPVFSLADSATFDTLGKRHHKFGEQRLWGTVGFALFAITSTFIMYVMSNQGDTFDSKVPFYIFTVLCCIAAGIAYFMDLSSSIKCGSMFDNFLALMKVVQVLVFLLIVLFFGMVTGAIESFLFWYLSDLGATTVVFGLSLVINCLFEVPLLFVSGMIIKRVGAVPCLYLAMLAVALRMLGYSLLTNPWWVLLIEPLHGVTFGIMWAAASTYAAMIAPPGMSATIQGLIGGMHFGIGKGLGSLLTGFLFERVGERWSFRVYAIAAVCLLGMYAALNHLVFHSHTRPSPARPHQQQEDKSDHVEAASV
ncbi:major facilitator superfamily domain-containing protein 6-like isoform X2 [Babylonia areolata]|uniref:major facilitator superfamily domain-containing protein 6-like isoform X2 n=1 Tax=Babylonia areolata TaxID=304850 RepID=UPI003FD3DC45